MSTEQKIERRYGAIVVGGGQAGLSAQQLADFAVNFGAPETRAHPVHGDFPGCPAVKVIQT